MGLLDAYQDSTDSVLQVMAARPPDPEKPKAKHSAWSVIPRAVAAAGTEIAGNIVDTAAGFGQVAAAAGGIAPGFEPDQQKNRAASLEAFDKLKTDGIDFRPEESRVYYDVAREMRPDPLTAGAAENVVFGLAKGLTKAVGAAGLGGAVLGAAAFGGSEGMTQAEDLAAQGVDKATRTKVGAVNAAFNAAGMALPVAGRTLAETAALVAVGGPGSFMAQQEISREILKGADYANIAEQFDPLDPTGLALATLLPAGFAAIAKAGSRQTKARPDAAPLTRDDLDAVMTHNLTAAQDAREEGAAALKATAEERKPNADPMPQRSGPLPDVAEQKAEVITLDAYRSKAEQLAKESPDMVARLDDAGKPVRLADELEAIRKQAQEGTPDEFGALDAPLLKVAAECALATGTAAL